MLDRSLLVVTGKGGVGKSAVTAALALRAARQGAKVLALAMSGGAGLAAHLHTDTLEYRPREVQPGLWAAAVVRRVALDEYLHLQLRAPAATPLGPVARLLDALADTVPGIRDVITMGKPVYEAERGVWDVVIADAPPTGQVMSYLRAPATVAGLVPAGRIERQAEWMAAFLADPARSGLVIVAIAEEIPVSETQQATDALTAERLIEPAAVVLNRVLTPLQSDPDAWSGPVADAARLQRSLVEEQTRWQSVLRPDITLPYLFGMLTPGEVSARLADEWPS